MDGQGSTEPRAGGSNDDKIFSFHAVFPSVPAILIRSLPPDTAGDNIHRHFNCFPFTESAGVVDPDMSGENL